MPFEDFMQQHGTALDKLELERSNNPPDSDFEVLKYSLKRLFRHAQDEGILRQDKDSYIYGDKKLDVYPNEGKFGIDKAAVYLPLLRELIESGVNVTEATINRIADDLVGKDRAVWAEGEPTRAEEKRQSFAGDDPSTNLLADVGRGAIRLPGLGLRIGGQLLAENLKAAEETEGAGEYLKETAGQGGDFLKQVADMIPTAGAYAHYRLSRATGDEDPSEGGLVGFLGIDQEKYRHRVEEGLTAPDVVYFGGKMGKSAVTSAYKGFVKAPYRYAKEKVSGKPTPVPVMDPTKPFGGLDIDGRRLLQKELAGDWKHNLRGQPTSLKRPGYAQESPSLAEYVRMDEMDAGKQAYEQRGGTSNLTPLRLRRQANKDMKRGELDQHDYNAVQSPKQLQDLVNEYKRQENLQSIENETKARGERRRADDAIEAGQALERRVNPETGQTRTAMEQARVDENLRLKAEDIKPREYDEPTHRKVSEGIDYAKKEGGVTFDPKTMDQWADEGYLVTIANDVVPYEGMSVEAVGKTHTKYAAVVDYFTESKMGLFDNKDGTFGVDINIVFPHTEAGRAAAMELAKIRRQQAAGDMYWEDGKIKYKDIEIGGEGKAPEVTLERLVNIVEGVKAKHSHGSIAEKIIAAGDAAMERIRTSMAEGTHTTFDLGGAAVTGAKLTRDAAIVGAGIIAQHGPSFKVFSREMIRYFGENVKPKLEKMYKQALKQHERFLESSSREMFPKVEELMDIFHRGEWGRYWYDDVKMEIQKMFGRDSKKMAKVFAYISNSVDPDGAATSALKAYTQWKRGEPIKVHYKKTNESVQRIFDGKTPFAGQKLNNFYDALIAEGRGDMVVVDMWMGRMFGWDTKPTKASKKAGIKKKSLTDARYDFIVASIRQLTREVNKEFKERGLPEITPIEVQAALWKGYKGMMEKKGMASRGVVPYWQQAVLRKFDDFIKGKGQKSNRQYAADLQRLAKNPKKVKLLRYARNEFNKMDPKDPRHRTGTGGKEDARLDENSIPRLNYYPKGAKPEVNVYKNAEYAHEVEIAEQRIYDLPNDPKGYKAEAAGRYITDKSGDRLWDPTGDPLGVIEERIHGAGYAGYKQSDGKVVLFEAVDAKPVRGKNQAGRYVDNPKKKTHAELRAEFEDAGMEYPAPKTKKVKKAAKGAAALGVTTAAAYGVSQLSDEDKKNGLAMAALPFGLAFIGRRRRSKPKLDTPEARLEAALLRKPSSQWGGKVRRAWDAYKRSMDNSLETIRGVTKYVEDISETRLRGDKNPFDLATALKQKEKSRSHQWINKETCDFDGRRTGEALTDILGRVKGDEYAAMEYAYVRHAKERWNQETPKNPGISLEDATYLEQKLRTPDRIDFANDLTNYERRLMDYLEEAGGLSPELRKVWEKVYPNHLPLYRDIGVGRLSKMSRKRGKKGYGDLGQATRRAHGSELPVANIIANLMIETEHIIDFANKARVGKSIADLIYAVEDPALLKGLIEELPQGNWKQVQVRAKDAIKALEELEGGEIDFSKKDIASEFLTLWQQQMSGKAANNTVAFWRDGKLRVFKLHPEFYRAVTMMDHRSLPGYMNMFTIPRRVKVMGATGMRASFGLVTNLLRDTFSYYMQSENPAAFPLRNFWGTYRAAQRKLGFNVRKEVDLWYNLGGDMVSLMNAEVPKAMKTASKMIKDNRRRIEAPTGAGWLSKKLHKGADKSFHVVRHPIEIYREIINIPEQGPRLTEFKDVYKRVKKETGDHRTAWIEAFNASQDVTLNFSRSGHIAQLANQLVPFFNAQLQDYSIFCRTFKKAPLRTALRGMSITAATLALWYHNKDQDWYKKLPAWRRVSFWNFEINGTIWSLPRPFSWGIVFAAIPETMMDYWDKKNPKDTKRLMVQLGENVLPPRSLAGADTWYELTAGEEGHNLFRNRQIVPSYVVDNLPPEERYSRYTTETGKAVGKALDVAPQKVDHAIHGFTGGMGLDIVRGVEAFAFPKHGKDYLATKPFIGRVTNYPSSHLSVGYLYEELNGMRDEFNRVRLGTSDLKPEEQDRLRIDYKTLEDGAKELSKIRKNISRIRTDNTLSSAEKDRQITALDQEADDVATRHVTIYWHREEPQALPAKKSVPKESSFENFMKKHKGK